MRFALHSGSLAASERLWYYRSVSTHERPRRRVARTGSATADLPETPRRPADLTGLLALQQSAGNRAVARLLIDDKSNDVKVPDSYANRTVKWDGTYQDKDAPDRRVFDVITGGGGRDAFMEGLGLNTLGSVRQVADATLGTAGARVASKGAKGDVGKTFKAAALDQHKLLHHYDANTFASVQEATIDLVMDPEDFLPEAPDLPEAGKPLTSVRKEFEHASVGAKKKKGKSEARALPTYWEFVCVLIALVEVGGLDAAKAKSGAKKTPGDVTEAVQSLHDHYMGRDVPLQYDDSSARRKIMTEWGYSMIFSGRSAWTELPSRVALAAGKYIFDIKGHTVAVDVLKDIGPTTKIDKESEYFKCHSDPKNYNKDEFKEQVHYIWKP